MGKPFYLGTDSELSVGAATAIAIITPAPADYGLTAATVTSYTALSTDYTAKLAVAVARETRSPVAVENKNAARKLLKVASVNLARTITAVSTVTNAQLIALGMNPRVSPQPRPVPQTPPSVDVLGVAGRLVDIRVHDPASGLRRKPFGATGANIYTAVGATPPTDPNLFQFQGTATRVKSQILFPASVANGATIWISACWVNARGQTGMASDPISFTLQGGNTLPEVA
jgi:hypothetical protein